MEEIGFKSDNYRIGGKLFAPDGARKSPGVLFLHGWTSSQERYLDWAETLAANGFVCLVFDMPGHGMSDGDLSTVSRKQLLESVVKGYDFLAQLPQVNSNRISAVGSSMGGYLAVLLAGRRPVSNLVLRAPANYPDENFDKPLKAYADAIESKKWRESALKPGESQALSVLHKYSGNVLIVESEKDEIIPHQAIQNYLNAVTDQTKVRHVVMMGAPHAPLNLGQRAEFRDIIVKWFKNRTSS